ncbi:MAG: I78 family peptidase inhibitor [Pseudomonadota bacterium]
MRSFTKLTPVFAFAALAAGTSAQQPPPRCDAAPAEGFIGQTASLETAISIQKATGATIFQWVFENSAVTMDYRPERVRVTYDRDLKILEVTCG